MKRVQAGEFEKIFGIDTLRDPAATAEMKASYDKHGIVCIALGDKIDLRLVVGQMLETLLYLPYRDEYMLNLRSESGRELHIKNPSGSRRYYHRASPAHAHEGKPEKA